MRKPLGVVAAIVPFNYPVELWSHKVAGALAAGNAVITKTPEDCPLTVIEISPLPGGGRPAARRAPGRDRPGETVGAALVKADGVQMIAMTGTTEAGRAILEDAAADAEEGAPRARRQRRHHRLRRRRHRRHRRGAGQRALHHRQRPDLLRGEARAGRPQICERPDSRRSSRKTQSLRSAIPSTADTDVGPLINRRGAERVEAQVQPGGRRRRHDRRRRHARRQLLRADDPDRRHARHAGLRRRDLRAGAAAHPLRRLRGGAGARQ